MNDTCPELSSHLQAEERAIRTETFSAVLNGELIQRSKDAKALVADVHEVSSHEEAIEKGLVKRVLAALHGTHRMSVQLTTWLGTFTPPLSVGGNAGVSAEVQDGIFSNMQQLVQTCSDGLHRMLAFEKERAMMRLKCLEEKAGSESEREAVWRRYESALEENQLHELRKVRRMRVPAWRGSPLPVSAQVTRLAPARRCAASPTRDARGTDLPHAQRRFAMRGPHAEEQWRASHDTQQPEFDHVLILGFRLQRTRQRTSLAPRVFAAWQHRILHGSSFLWTTYLHGEHRLCTSSTMTALFVDHQRRLAGNSSPRTATCGRATRRATSIKSTSPTSPVTSRCDDIHRWYFSYGTVECGVGPVRSAAD